jgi:phage-related minor tail protein
MTIIATEATQKLQQISDNFAKATDKIKADNNQLQRNLQSVKASVDSLNPSMNEVLRKITPIKGEISSARSLIGNTNKAMEKIAADIGKNLGQALAGHGTQSMKDTLLNGVTSLMNNFFAKNGRHIGGTVASRGGYVVGEKGPELFVPSTSGSIVPGNQMAQSSRPINLYMNITTNDAYSFRNSQGQILAQTAQMLRKAGRNL